ncbi:hypothetical protein GSI_00131 [Ganoderma sinense ZZ0214-1]|uniref:Uncharacterized protein n=1 Tax=Ganoderma sinense ZZ0214-1 TaxID=1077348 RepID=A0A2G8SRS4_9APHY|nr:hypothetical protein GSI_00131 [Ganoderma sinense ZZ0214-1]
MGEQKQFQEEIEPEAALLPHHFPPLRHHPTAAISNEHRLSYAQAIFTVHQPPLGQVAQEVDKRDVHRDQIPDFVRMIFTYTQSDATPATIRRLIDLWEIKGLNVAERWDSVTARLQALVGIDKHIEQLWMQARAAFAHNEQWTVVYALLIIGPYFSQVVWQRPPDGQAQKVSLSAHFRYALSLALKEQFDGCETQPSWFDPPRVKPDPIVHVDTDPDDDPVAYIRNALVNRSVEKLQGKKKAQFVQTESSVNEDSQDDVSVEYELSPESKRIYRRLGANPLSSPLPTHRSRRPGLGAANRRRISQIPVDNDHVGDLEIAGELREIGFRRDAEEEDERDDYADDEETGDDE